MRWNLTLKDPLNVISPLLLGSFAEKPTQRFRVGQSVSRHNASGRPVVVGSSYGYRYFWVISSGLSESNSLRLEGFETLQNTRGYLVLDDEVDYVTPEVLPHRKTLITGTTYTIDGLTTGFARFAVWLYFPEAGAFNHWGMVGDVPYKKGTVIIHEIPGVVP